jgi:hypothetical protein
MKWRRLVRGMRPWCAAGTLLLMAAASAKAKRMEANPSVCEELRMRQIVVAVLEQFETPPRPQSAFMDLDLGPPPAREATSTTVFEPQAPILVDFATPETDTILRAAEPPAGVLVAGTLMLLVACRRRRHRRRGVMLV